MCLAVPARIKSIHKDRAIVDFGGIKKEISLGILQGVKKGDYVLIHAGFAITKMKRHKAKDVLKALTELKNVAKE